MKYLSFDIEAANGYKLYSICSIGIVIADEQFNILSRENIWINPKTKYNLNGTRKNVGIDLHLDKKLLDSSPDFSEVYGRIKAMLTSRDVLVLGHAVDSDVRMLNAACKHYKLPCIEFDFICSQLLYKLYKGENDVKALSKIAAELNLEYREHNSEDDAWMAMMTLKYLCESTGYTPLELCAKYRVRIGGNVNFELTRPVSLEGQVSKRRVANVAIDKLKRIAQNTQTESNEYRGVKFAIARSIEIRQDGCAEQLVQSIVSRGGTYTPKLGNCNAYICAQDPTSQDIMREKRVDELVKQGLCKTYIAQQILQGETK
ncbi:MAG: hypothetical protein NC350_06615 [Corallococcus sp.]|nr:hypothetical protein [Corallococcus sp.]